ncbi:hypothetical protein FDK38_001592 [Candidozyma auris]|nr:hypothetical protein FDK38_001592 [[Candida] auris]
MELVFLRHATRADHASPNNPPLYHDYKSYDPSVSVSAVGEASKVARDIADVCNFEGEKRNVFVHFSPYLRCCQTADLLVSALMKEVPQTKLKISMLCDFALSEWLHDGMKNTPPFVDSNEAYHMYTPNVKVLENKRCVSNFRPTTTLGPWNEPGLSYRDYADRCKTYFKKLVATYDKPSHVQNNDLVIVVGHGYAINHFMTFFINHPIFEEIPECAMNYARRENDVWTLKRDCLQLLHCEDIDSTLNLENDIVVYKSNFVKKDELDENKQYPAIGFGGLKLPNQGGGDSPSNGPRPSFRVEQSAKDIPDRPNLAKNFLCPTARNWNPSDSNKFSVKSEFKLKVMNDDAFKKAFDLSNPPTHPISPEVSPNSEPTRTNSVIDLVKLNSNDEIQRPFKLRYSSASDIPVHYLNSKVNSHVNLAQFQRNAYSNNNSSSEQGVGLSVLSGGSLSPRDYSDMEAAETASQNSHSNMSEVISRLSRIRSLQRKRAQTPSFGKIKENSSDESSDSESNKFSLSFNKEKEKEKEKEREKRENAIKRTVSGSPSVPNRARGNSIKLIPSVLNQRPRAATTSMVNGSSSANDSSNDSSIGSAHNVKSTKELGKTSTSESSGPGRLARPIGLKKTPSMFYNLDSDSADGSSEGEDDEESSSPPKEQHYTWFGQNVKGYV